MKRNRRISKQEEGYDVFLEMLELYHKDYNIYAEDLDDDYCYTNKLLLQAYGTGWSAGFHAAVKWKHEDDKKIGRYE